MFCVFMNNNHCSCKEAMCEGQKINDYGTGVLQHKIEALAHVLLVEIEQFCVRKKSGVNLPSGRRNNS